MCFCFGCTQVLRSGVVCRSDGANVPTELRRSGSMEAAGNGALLDNGDEVIILSEVTSEDDVFYQVKLKEGRKTGYLRAEHCKVAV